MKTTISFNAMIIMIFGIGIIVGGVTGSALAQTDNQTKAEQGKNNTESGSGIMDKIGDMAKEKISQGIQDIIGGGGSQ
jgi:hypothetical protein